MIVTLLTNPMSGHGNAPHASERAVAQFQKLGIDVVQIVGRDAAHARELVDEALNARHRRASWWSAATA